MTRQGSGRYHHGYGYDPSSDGWKVDCSSGTQKSFSTYTVAKPEVKRYSAFNVIVVVIVIVIMVLFLVLLLVFIRMISVFMLIIISYNDQHDCHCFARCVACTPAAVAKPLSMLA